MKFNLEGEFGVGYNFSNYHQELFLTTRFGTSVNLKNIGSLGIMTEIRFNSFSIQPMLQLYYSSPLQRFKSRGMINHIIH